MTALPNDFVRLEGPAGAADLNCLEYGLPWPPPDVIAAIGDTHLDIPMELVTRSEVPDSEAANDPGLARAALYWPIDPEGPGQ